MVRYHFVAAALAAAASAVPLNINLGAYSPALVVGDGEISFGGNQDVASLMNALEGAAANAASGSKAAGAVAAASAPSAAPAPAIAAGKDQSSAAEGQPTAQSAPAASIPTLDPSLQETAAQISTLQGMGKEIAPREGTAPDAPKDKRDLAGFDRALQFAEAALTKGPVIQMGTGEGGSGVGLTVDNRPAGAQVSGQQAPAVASARKARVKREEPGSTQPRRRTKVTTMFIRRGLPAGLQKSSQFDARDIPTIPVAVPALKLKRDDGVEEKRATANVDAINLNVADQQGITMTFVETADEDDEE